MSFLQDILLRRLTYINIHMYVCAGGNEGIDGHEPEAHGGYLQVEDCIIWVIFIFPLLVSFLKFPQ